MKDDVAEINERTLTSPFAQITLHRPQKLTKRSRSVVLPLLSISLESCEIGTGYLSF